MDYPRWYQQLTWHAPIDITDFITGKAKPNIISEGAGIYAFTVDATPEITGANILYIGKADGKHQTLRHRICDYISCLKRGTERPTARQHKGMEKLNRFYHRVLIEGDRKTGGEVYVRWAGCTAARDIEGDLIRIFEPCFNNKQENRYDYDDDDRIPDYHLYDVNVHGRGD